MSDTQAAEAPSTEARARAQGWRPKEEFKGPVERWRDAETFLKASEDFMPVALERNRVMEKNLTEARAEIQGLKGELGEVKSVLTEFREFASKADQRAYDKARRELLAEREVAVSHADQAAFKDAEARLVELDKGAPKPVIAPVVEAVRQAAASVQVDPVITQWIYDNPWVNSDPVVNAAAKAADLKFQATYPALPLADRLGMVRTEMARRFPEFFENASREAPSAVAPPSGGSPVRKTNKHSYDNLPPEARKACDKFVKKIPGFKVEDYVRDYDWPE